MGPRFLLPALPFLLLALGELARQGKLSAFEKSPKFAVVTWGSVIALGIVSMALSLPISIFDPQITQGNQDEVLRTATIATRLNVPQFAVLYGFYRGASAFEWAKILVFGFCSALLAGIAAYIAPKTISGIQRNDFPFHTVDGSAAPPPPIP